MNGQLEQIRLRINETDKELSCLFSQPNPFVEKTDNLILYLFH